MYVFSARGGLYAGTSRDTQTPYVRDILAFLGMDDIEFVYAEGLAISEASKQQGIARAHAEIDQLLGSPLGRESQDQSTQAQRDKQGDEEDAVGRHAEDQRAQMEELEAPQEQLEIVPLRSVRDLFADDRAVFLVTGRQHFAVVERVLGERAHQWAGNGRRRLYANCPPPG